MKLNKNFIYITIALVFWVAMSFLIFVDSKIPIMEILIGVGFFYASYAYVKESNLIKNKILLWSGAVFNVMIYILAILYSRLEKISFPLVIIIPIGLVYSFIYINVLTAIDKMDFGKRRNK